MRNISLFLLILSCYHNKIKKEKLHEKYSFARQENLIQVTVIGLPSDSLEKMKRRLDSLEDAKRKAVEEFRNKIYSFRLGTIELSSYLSSNSLKYEIDEIIFSNAEIINREWNQEDECRLIMSLDVSSINNIITAENVRHFNAG